MIVVGGVGKERLRLKLTCRSGREIYISRQGEGRLHGHDSAAYRIYWKLMLYFALCSIYHRDCYYYIVSLYFVLRRSDIDA